MNWRNRIGIYGCYLCGTAGIGFTLPYLPLYLGQEGLSDGAIGWISTCAALSALAQFPIGLWSDRIATRKPFLLGAMALLTLAGFLLRDMHGALILGVLVVLFAENGICRAVIDSLSGAEVTALSPRNEIGAALGRLRMWKPIGIVCVALFGSLWAERFGVAAILTPVAILQAIGLCCAVLIRENRTAETRPSKEQRQTTGAFAALADGPLWAFIGAMVLFHAANAPGGVYLGLYLKRGMHAPDAWLAYAFVVSMIAWMLIVLPGGKIADRFGRKPLLILTWMLMTIRLLIVALARNPTEIVINQFLDGAANGLFAVIAATWVTDRLADPRRSGEAQVIVGTSLVLGSAIGPAVAALFVEQLGYQALFGALAAVGALATGIVVLFVPETLRQPRANEASLPANSLTGDFTPVP
ncbi:MAG TPA: MFS transporter [Planctomycetaceae bacterium]|nr:MFS transporter [Planctomycetaceae bacterium]